MISMEMKDIHSFRRAFEDLNYGWVPSRFPLYTAYLEVCKKIIDFLSKHNHDL